MSGESESKIEDVFVNQLGAKYPLAKIKEADKRGYGIRAYPSYRLIAPDGTVHSHGKPSKQLIEELLQEVMLPPELPDDSRYGPVRSMWEKKQYDRMRDYLDKMLQQDKLDEEMRTVYQAQRDDLDKRHDMAKKRVAKLGGGPDYLRARDKLEQLEKDWKGFEAATAAEAELKRFAKDATIKKEIAASKALQKLQDKYDPSRIAQRKKLMEALGKFVEKYDGTHAAAQAREQLGG